MGTFSIPGGSQGTIELFYSYGVDHFAPVRVLSASSGGLLLLGYGTAVYRYLKKEYGGSSQTAAVQEDER
jgi:hypothetical protein